MAHTTLSFGAARQRKSGIRPLYIQVSTRGGTQRVNASRKVSVRIQGQVHIVNRISNPTDHAPMFSMMHIAHQMMQTPIIGVSPPMHVPCQAIHLPQQIEASNPRTVQQLHQYASGMRSKVSTHGLLHGQLRSPSPLVRHCGRTVGGHKIVTPIAHD